MKRNTYQKRNFLTINEYAEAVRRSPVTVRGWIAARMIEFRKVGLGEYKYCKGKWFRRFH